MVDDEKKIGLEPYIENINDKAIRKCLSFLKENAIFKSNTF